MQIKLVSLKFYKFNRNWGKSKFLSKNRLVSLGLSIHRYVCAYLDQICVKFISWLMVETVFNEFSW